MDPITHVCSGVLLGQALRPSSPVRRPLLVILALAAFAPDFDAVTYLWGADAFYRFHHTYTHTLPGVALLAVLLAGIESQWIRTMSFPRLVALNLAGGTIHLLGDVIAVWPLPLLWPWSDADFALRWTGDFDLVVLVVVGVSTGLAETDKLQAWAPWILGGVVLLLVAYFWWMPGWAGLGMRG